MTERIDRARIAELLELEEEFVLELERHEIITPDPGGGFDYVAVERVRLCWSMHDLLGVNMPGLEVALHLLSRWQGERRQVAELLQHLREEQRDEEQPDEEQPDEEGRRKERER